MKFENTKVFNIEGALRGMRFPMKGLGDTVGDIIGPRDLKVARNLKVASEEGNFAHSKFLRQIMVSVDITAPRYYWSEFDTYKVGTVADSESTMHKLVSEIEQLCIEDFQVEEDIKEYILESVVPKMKEIVNNDKYTKIDKLRRLKQMLPEAFLQKRHWTANYEVIRTMVRQREFHRLSEWNHEFIKWVKTLPYAKEFIFGEESREC